MLKNMLKACSINSLNQRFRASSLLRYSSARKDTSLETLPQAYKPKEVENGWYDWWEANGYFKPNGGERCFTMVLPPPNVTGTLHLGHALTATIQDVLARWRRMHGDSVLWVPGTDHAGIATQVVVEKALLKEKNVSKFDLGREKFLEEVWRWKCDKGDRIVDQLRAMGASLDWSRHVFTMDPVPSVAVKEAFIKLFEDGLIYRQDALVNWSCALQSSISDIEVESRPIAGPTSINVPGCSNPVQFGLLHYIAYPLHESDEEIIVATTRPETILGDTAIALHPSDPRRSKLEGKQVWHPLRECTIPIVFDDSVDPNFGTGALKITPLHDNNDFNVAQSHGLDRLQIFDERGRIVSGQHCGKQRFDVRQEILEQLKGIGLFRGSKDHTMLVPMCSRSGDVVEMMLKAQWFLNCSKAAKRAVQAVDQGQLQLFPENYSRVWKNWLDNVKDWNISRQLWWGHRIPAYHVTWRDKQDWVAARDAVEAKRKASQLWSVDTEEISATADEDVLDTWFSSSLQPLYGVGADTHRLPLSLLETGHDIIFFWVARMVMISLMLKDQLPFTKVLLHGVICDAHGHKMSKSLGNAVTPEQVVVGSTYEELAQSLRKAHISGLITDQQLADSLAGQKKLFPDGIPECGTDGLRFTLCSQAIQSSHISFDVTTCHQNKLFCNKVLQAFRFALSCLDRVQVAGDYAIDSSLCNGYDSWILSRLAAAVDTVNSSLEEFQFHSATLALKNFLYFELCDVYIETVKTVLKEASLEEQKNSISCLLNSLDVGLRLLHPFMPFLTEEIYQRLPAPLRPCESIMVAPYPKTDDWLNWRSPKIDDCQKKAQEIVISLRKLKALYGTKGEKPEVIVDCRSESLTAFLQGNLAIVTSLARASSLTLKPVTENQLASFYVKEQVDDETTVYSNLPNHTIVRQKRLEPMIKKEEKLRKQLEKLNATIANSKLAEEGKAKVEQTRRALRLQLQQIEEIKHKLRRS